MNTRAIEPPARPRKRVHRLPPVGFVPPAPDMPRGELVDAPDSKSCSQKACRFDPDYRHHLPKQRGTRCLTRCARSSGLSPIGICLRCWHCYLATLLIRPYAGISPGGSEARTDPQRLRSDCRSQEADSKPHSRVSARPAVRVRPKAECRPCPGTSAVGGRPEVREAPSDRRD